MPTPIPHIASDDNTARYRYTHTEDASATASTVTGHHRGGRKPTLGIRPRQLPLLAVRRTPHRRSPRRHLRPLHRHPVRQHQGYDIKHIVAHSEAHASGLCAADPGTKDELESDLTNLTLASPSVNRHQKSDKDAAEWIPNLNACWYVDRIVQVRLEYGLTIDRAEADAINAVLDGCTPTDMVVPAPTTTETFTTTATPTPTPAPAGNALAMYHDNGNERISCAGARSHGIAPARRGHPAH